MLQAVQHTIVWTLDFVATDGRSFLEQAGVTLSTGPTTGAIDITFAHKLAHRPGRFERALNLALHTDRHPVASNRCPVLGHVADAFQLPANCGTMLLLAIVAPLWRRIMDPRVVSWRTRAGVPALR